MLGFILNLQYPKTLEDAEDSFNIWTNRGLDCVENAAALHKTKALVHIGTWSAPAWANPGDICFFGYAKSALTHIARLQHEAEEDGKPALALAIKSSRDVYDEIGGKVFGFAYVGEKPKPAPGHKDHNSLCLAHMYNYKNIEPIAFSDIAGLQINSYGGVTRLSHESLEMLCAEAGIGNG